VGMFGQEKRIRDEILLPEVEQLFLDGPAITVFRFAKVDDVDEPFRVHFLDLNQMLIASP